MATVTKSLDLAGEGLEAAPPPEPPTLHAGAYTIVAPIAAGGGGSVWLARDTRRSDPGCTAAVKFLHPDAAKDRGLRRRFLREAEFAAAIHHPNVVEVVEVGEASGHPYLVMPFVAGTTVRELLRQGQLPIDAIVTIVSDALCGLTAAHDVRGTDGAPIELVHRDISPHNLLVAVDGTTKLTDFGIARPALQSGVSTTRWAQGKVSYFSPEQGRGEPLDRRSDLFAMGTVLWECLTGRSLFRADDPFVTAHRVQTMRVPAPSTLRKGLSAEFDAVVAKALAADREQRFASASLMLEALSAAARDAGISTDRASVAALVAAARPASPEPSPPVRAPSADEPNHPSPPRGRRAIVAASVVGFVVLVGAVAFAMSDHRSPSEVSAPPPMTAVAPPPAAVESPSAITPPPAAPEPAPPPTKSGKSGTPRHRTPRSSPRAVPSSNEPRLPSPTNPF
jgi:serine/threonine protein kinase